MTDRIDTDGLPVVLENGGPTAADTYEAIEDGECGNCGYDRLMVRRQYGQTTLTCMLCDAYTHDRHDEWVTPTTDKQRRRELHEYADEDGSTITKHGERGTVRSDDHVEVFGYENTDVLKVFTNTYCGLKFHSLLTEELDGLLEVLEDSTGYVSEFIEDHYDGDRQVRPSVPYNPNAIHVGRFVYRHEPQWAATGFLIDVVRDLDVEFVVHFPPNADGIAV